jgi:hypothetical protein
MIWQLMTRKNYLVVTGSEKKWQSLDFHMPPRILNNVICRLEVELESHEYLQSIKKELNGKPD